MAMYQEAEKLAEEVLKADPRDETARANAMAARNSMKFRSNAMGRVMPLVFCPPATSALSPQTDCRSPVGCSNQNQRVETVSNGAKDFYEEEANERLRDQEGDNDDKDDSEEDDNEEDDPPLSKTHMVHTDFLYTLQGVKM